MTAAPASRNDRCPCGSGRRYKHCHGRTETALPPRDPEALFDLGNAARARGEFTTAIDHYRAALAIVPAHPGLLNNLGLAHDGVGAHAQAEAFYRQALAVAPTAIDTRANLAQNLYAQQRHAEAAAEFGTALAGWPEAPASLWANYGVCQREAGDVAAAYASLERAVALEPAPASLWFEFGVLAFQLQHFSTAQQAFGHCRALDPGWPLAGSMLLQAKLQCADWDGVAVLMDEEVTAARAAAPGVATARRRVDPFGFLSVSDDPALQRAVAQHYAATHTMLTRAAPPRDRATRTLRLGFVSTDFCEHPVGRLIVGLLEHLDRERFAVTTYAIGERQDDAIRRRLRAAVDGFAVSPRLDARALAEQIADDRIDILFDLGGYSGAPILDVLAHRPAPLQVNFLGYTGTLGMPACDFIACDAYCIAPSAALHYTERPLLVAPCYLPSDPARGDGAVPCLTRADYGLDDDAIVVCALTNTGKIVPHWFAAAMRILAAAPRTALWLRQPAADAMERLRAQARAAGIAGERIVFAPADTLDRYQARFALADFMLDSWPYGSHTTVNDALFAGLPVLALAGRSFAGRASASQLAVLGLGSLIASDADDGVARAIALAQDAHTRQRTRDRLADPNVRAALFDMDRYARSFETALRAAWVA